MTQTLKQPKSIELLGRKHVGYVALVDDADYDWLIAMGTWGVTVSKQGFIYAALRKDYQILTMHRVILGLNPNDGIEGDHRNGNTLDNTRANLRKATSGQNRRNQKIGSRNTTGFKGVSTVRRPGHPDRYRATIFNNGRLEFIGGFLTALEAAKAYDSRAIELFGEFARTNIK